MQKKVSTTILPPQWRIQDFRTGGAKDEAPQAPRSSRRRREDRGAEGAEKGGVWGGGPPPHWGRGLGRGLCPLPRNFFDFSSEKE